MYRRDFQRRTRPSGATDGMNGFRATVLKQTGVCVVALVLLIGLKAYDTPETKFIQNTVVQAVSTTTDVPGLWDRIKSFFSGLPSGPDAAPDGDPLANMTAPLPGAVTSPFGMRIDPVDNQEKFHYGVDLDGKTGDKIRAAAAGEVAEVGSDDQNGNFVLIQHSDKLYTFYAHCEKTLPVQGDQVKAGQVIATVGSTGKTTGPHLHFEIREGDNSLDPQAFIQFEETAQ